VPTTAPLSLVLATGNNVDVSSAPSTASIFVIGNYANNVTLDLTSSVTGTTYASSNPNVLTVDANGNVNILALGTAVVTVQNSGLKTFADFDVENPASPLAPQDVTAAITISASGFQLNRTTGFFVQTVQLTNSLPIPIIGPLYFLLTNLPAGVTLVSNDSGQTQRIPPARSAYFAVQTADGGLTLQPGASISLSLQFLNPSRARISYTPKLYRVIGTP
jgi:hypothetical protein